MRIFKFSGKIIEGKYSVVPIDNILYYKIKGTILTVYFEEKSFDDNTNQITYSYDSIDDLLKDVRCMVDWFRK